jgi:hypothetical protein
MQEVVPVALVSWVVLTIALFWRRPGRDAALFSMIAGWAFLPVATYPASVFAEPIGSGGSMHALAVPSAHLLNKAIAIGLGCLIGVVLFDWPAVLRVRPLWLDAPMLGWCLVPIASTLSNGLPLADGLSQTRYLAMAWGVPYAVGRIYLGGDEPLRRFGLALVLAGLVYLPFGLLEFARGPFLYSLVYGPHPYRFDGADRFVGYRPLVFLEHGNQLGIWIAEAAVSAVWLWGAGRMSSIARVPGGVAAVGLVGACLVFQSHSAIGLMLAALAVLALVSWMPTLPRSGYAGVVAAVLLLSMAGATAVLAAEGGGWSGLRGKVRGVFRDLGKTSFTWRLARAEENLGRIAERPVLGWGRPDWSAADDGPFFDPAALSLWLMASGMFGAIGLICSTAVLLVPVGIVLWRLPATDWARDPCVAIGLTAALLLVNALDSLLNSVLLLPLLAGAGGINSWSATSARGESGPVTDREWLARAARMRGTTN